MSVPRVALISFKSTSSRKLEIFREALKQLSEFIEWQTISSVYKVCRPAESFSSLRRMKSEELLDGFACVALGHISIEPAQLMQQMSKAEEALRHEELRRSLSLNLLAVDFEMTRFPDLTLPHPEFHLHPEELVPASEVWPDYLHPVLNCTIRELARQWVEKNWGEYHCAGRPLLDF